jgi:hypothetical protein
MHLIAPYTIAIVDCKGGGKCVSASLRGRKLRRRGDRLSIGSLAGRNQAQRPKNMKNRELVALSVGRRRATCYL